MTTVSTTSQFSLAGTNALASTRATSADTPDETVPVIVDGTPVEQPSKFHEFLVLLDDQATREVEKAFSMPMGLERRQFVVKTLRENLMKTQQPLWDVLEGLEAAGHVEKFQPLWIQNAIVVRGDDEAEAVMSRAAGVAQAIKSATHTVRPPAGDEFGNLEGSSGASDALSGVDELGALGVEGDAKKGGGKKEDDIHWNLTRVKADQAKKQGLDGKGVTVAILDTGVDFSHPALLSKYRGYDSEMGDSSHLTNWFDAEKGSKEPVDDGEHGTHVAGTVGGEYAGNQTGLATGAKMIGARGLGEHGGTDGMLLTAFQELVGPRVPTPGTSPGFRRELSLGADVINNSWGSTDGLSVSYMNALRNMAAMGVINLFAAGNDGANEKAGSVGSPASSPYVITVAATDKEDNPADFSSRGPNPLPTKDDEPIPFIAMPGVDIYSTVPGGGFERGWQGTSMATPLATGLVALAQQAAVEETGAPFDVNAMREVLKRQAQDVSTEGVDDATGHGIPTAEGLRATVKAVAKDLGLIKEPVADEPAKEPAKEPKTDPVKDPADDKPKDDKAKDPSPKMEEIA